MQKNQSLLWFVNYSSNVIWKIKVIIKKNTEILILGNTIYITRPVRIIRLVHRPIAKKNCNYFKSPFVLRKLQNVKI